MPDLIGDKPHAVTAPRKHHGATRLLQKRYKALQQVDLNMGQASSTEHSHLTPGE